MSVGKPIEERCVRTTRNKSGVFEIEDGRGIVRENSS